jgi:hypothetical protein
MLGEYRGLRSVIRAFKDISVKFYSDIQVNSNSVFASKSKSQITHTAS